MRDGVPLQAGEGKESALTRRARALYEDTVVPVRAIAQLCGVTERTLYKYAQKGKWRPRVRRLTKGAGGRFIPLADAGLPVERGLKALDPAGAKRAAEACDAAGALAAEALAGAQATRRLEADARTLGYLVQVLRDLAAMDEAMAGEAKSKAKKEAKPSGPAAAGWREPDADELRRLLMQKIEAVTGVRRAE